MKPVVAEEKEAPMPKSWFFEVYEETAEEEASNMMEHSACCLDISSDDDVETRQNKLEEERGKENVPPPDWVSNPNSRRAATIAVTETVGKAVENPKPAKRVRPAKGVDAMDQDRAALGELDAKDFHPEEVEEEENDAVAAAAVVEVEEKARRSSGLSKEWAFELTPTKKVPEDVAAKELEKAVGAKGNAIFICEDEVMI